MRKTEKNIVERMLGRKMTEEESKKMDNVDYLEAMTWAKNRYMEEKRKQVLST